MKLEFVLEKEHFIEMQLYTSDQTQLNVNQIKRGRWSLLIMMVALGFITSRVLDDIIPAVVFGVMGIYLLITYPRSYRKRVYKNVLSYTDEQYKYLFDQKTECYLENGKIRFRDDMVEEIIQVEEFEYLTELKDIYLLKMKRGKVEIIPKACITDQDAFKQMLIDMNIYYVDDTDWKWRK